MLPCHCKPKIYLRFIEVCTYPLIHNFGLEASALLCNLERQASPKQHELGSRSSAFRLLEVRIENDSDRIFFKSKFFHSFLETTFLHVSCYPFIVSRKYIFGFSKSAPTPRYTILDSRLPPCNAISEGRPLLSNTSSEAGALPLEVCIENDSDRNFSKS